MAQKLYELIEQLTAGGISGRKLRRQFHDCPEDVTLNLSPEARKALYAMQQTQSGEITTQVKKELEAEGIGDQYQAWEDWFLNWVFPLEEFVPPGKLPADCQYEGSAYPNPKPLVYDIMPRAAKVGAGGGTQEVTVSGQGFVTGRTRLELQKKGTSTKLVLVPKYSGIEGSFRCGHFYADVTLPGPISAVETYEIRVILTTGITNGNPVELGPLPVRKDPATTQPIVFTLNP
jgi:hypothetical protein